MFLGKDEKLGRMEKYHISVLLHEAIDALNVRAGGRYIDGTLGGGGHTELILAKGGIVLGIDQDQDALDYVRTTLGSEKGLRSVKGNFRNIDAIAEAEGFTNVAGIFLDIGISSHHVDSAERGFSFQADGPLDMRMDKELEIKAGDLVNILTKGELYDLFTKLGEERFSRAIVAGIVGARKIKKIETTGELAEIIRKAVPFAKKGMHPATKVFQALRIAVNDELHSLQESLPRAVSLLAPGGCLAVISFHSLEDRIVKHSFREFEEKGWGEIMTKKPIIPSEKEIEENARARSAKLRVFKKL